MNNKEITIRKTNTDDFDDVMQVVKLAFGYDKEVYIIIEKGANFYLKSIPLRKDFEGNKDA